MVVGIALDHLVLGDVAPGALGVLLGAADAGAQVLEAVDFQASAAVARRHDALVLAEKLEAQDHG